jgi:hypothetical protein
MTPARSHDLAPQRLPMAAGRPHHRRAGRHPARTARLPGPDRAGPDGRGLGDHPRRSTPLAPPPHRPIPPCAAAHRPDPPDPPAVGGDGAVPGHHLRDRPGVGPQQLGRAQLPPPARGTLGGTRPPRLLVHPGGPTALHGTVGRLCHPAPAVADRRRPAGVPPLLAGLPGMHPAHRSRPCASWGGPLGSRRSVGCSWPPYQSPCCTPARCRPTC